MVLAFSVTSYTSILLIFAYKDAHSVRRSPVQKRMREEISRFLVVFFMPYLRKDNSREVLCNGQKSK